MSKYGVISGPYFPAVRLNAEILRYFDNSSLKGEIVIGKGKFNVSVTRSRFFINTKKYIIKPTQKIEFLNLQIDPVGMI